MKKKNRPPKIDNVSKQAKNAIADGLYRYTAHAETRKFERFITEEDALHIIETGWRAQSHDEYCEIHKSWKYVFEGKTLQDELLRVVVGFDDEMLLIVTVINIRKAS